MEGRLYAEALRDALGVIIDPEDANLIKSYVWRLNSCGYAVFVVKKKMTLMHRIIMKAKSGEIVDHINGNILDNRKSNLRFCTHAQNMANSVKKRGTCKLKGVTKLSAKHNSLKPYRAQITANKVRWFLGDFKTEIEAHKAYCNAAKLHHKEFFHA